MLLYLVIWLYIWDDEVDQPEGAYADDLQSAESYRQRTSSFVSQCLQTGECPPLPDLSGEHRIIDSFRDVGRPLAKFYDAGLYTGPYCHPPLTATKRNFNESSTK